MSETDFEFKTSIPKEWKDLFNRRNIYDSISYLETAQNRIQYSIYDLFSYSYAKDQWKKTHKQMIDTLHEKGSVNHNFLFNPRIIYCGSEMKYDLFFNKINFSFFSALHSFFDVYGKFLLRALLPTCESLDKDYFSDVVNKLKEHSEYNEIVRKIKLYTRDDKFSYIYDLNNSNKHNQDISVESILIINDGSIEADIQEFKRKNNDHPKENMLDKLGEIEKFVVDFYNDITAEVIQYLSNE